MNKKYVMGGVVGATVLSLFVLAGRISHSSMETAFIWSGYYATLLIVGLWALTLWKCGRNLSFSDPNRLKSIGVGAILAALLTWSVFLSVKPGYRILADETNLIAVSKSMAFEHKPVNETMAIWKAGGLHSIREKLPKRPLLFPFGVSVVHLLRGYTYYNAFYFNGLILFCFLTLLYAILTPRFGPLVGISSMFLLLSQPIITLTATSAGFDFFSAFFLFVVLISLYQHLKIRTPSSLALLSANLLMFIHIRYESMAFVALIIGGLFLLRKIRLTDLRKYMWFYLLTPLLLLPRFWQYLLTGDRFENYKGPAFSVEHFLEHIGKAWIAFTDFGRHFPYATLTNVVGFAAGVYLVTTLIKKRKDQNMIRPFIMIGGVLLFAYLAIILSYHAGDATAPYSARMFIPLLTLLAILPCFAVPQIRRAKVSLFVFSLVMFCLYHSSAIEGNNINALTLLRTTRSTYRFLRHYPKERLIVVADRPGLYTVLGHGAISFRYANAHKETILGSLKCHTFNELLTLQRIDYPNETPAPFKLDAEFKLETLHEVQFRRDKFLRISKVHADGPCTYQGN